MNSSSYNWSRILENLFSVTKCFIRFFYILWPWEWLRLLLEKMGINLFFIDKNIIFTADFEHDWNLTSQEKVKSIGRHSYILLPIALWYIKFLKANIRTSYVKWIYRIKKILGMKSFFSYNLLSLSDPLWYTYTYDIFIS